MNIRRTIRRRLRSSGASGFTLIELLVTVALLSAVVLIVSQIFRISTEAAGRTAAGPGSLISTDRTGRERGPAGPGAAT